MSEWIEINLPWHVYSSFNYDLEQCPSFNLELKELFGTNLEELQSKLFPKAKSYEYISEHPYWIEFRKLEDEIETDIAGADADNNLSSDELRVEIKRRLIALDNTAVNTVFEYRRLRSDMLDWVDEQPEAQAVKERNNKIIADVKAKESVLSFCGRGLAKPGVLIEYKSEDGALIQELIGHINCNAGVCGDCRSFDNDKVILRYKTVWEPL